MPLAIHKKTGEIVKEYDSQIITTLSDSATIEQGVALVGAYDRETALRINSNANPIARAIASLDFARKSGGELDMDEYEESYTLLVAMREAILILDQQINTAERSPTCDDYNEVLSILGLV